MFIEYGATVKGPVGIEGVITTEPEGEKVRSETSNRRTAMLRHTEKLLGATFESLRQRAGTTIHLNPLQERSVPVPSVRK